MGVYADVAQLVEHHLAKVGVAGSNPVVRSNAEGVAARAWRDLVPDGGRTVRSVSSKLELVQPSGDLPRTTHLLAERWATRFCDIQRRVARGEGLKFIGAALAAIAWCTFVLLAKGSVDFQASDLVVPGIVTVVAIGLAAFGFARERRAKSELREATARLAFELHKGPASRQETEQSSRFQ